MYLGQGEGDEEDGATDENVMPTGRVVGILQRNWREYVASFASNEVHSFGLPYIQHFIQVYVTVTVHISLCQNVGHFDNSLIAFFMHIKTVGRIFVLIMNKLKIRKIGR